MSQAIVTPAYPLLAWWLRAASVGEPVLDDACCTRGSTKDDGAVRARCSSSSVNMESCEGTVVIGMRGGGHQASRKPLRMTRLCRADR